MPVEGLVEDIVHDDIHIPDDAEDLEPFEPEQQRTSDIIPVEESMPREPELLKSVDSPDQGGEDVEDASQLDMPVEESVSVSERGESIPSMAAPTEELMALAVEEQMDLITDVPGEHSDLSRSIRTVPIDDSSMSIFYATNNSLGRDFHHGEL